jgi:hypothetical protein
LTLFVNHSIIAIGTKKKSKNQGKIMDLTSKYWIAELAQERLENIEKLERDILNLEGDWNDDLNIAKLDCIIARLENFLKLAETLQADELDSVIQGYLKEVQEQKSALEKRKVSLVKDVFAVSSGCVSSLCYAMKFKITDYERLEKIQIDWVVWVDNNFDFYFENWRDSWAAYIKQAGTALSQIIENY